MVDLIDGSKPYALAVIEHATRRVRVLGTTMHPTSDWVVQQARNLVMDLEDVGLRAKFLIHDRDVSFGAAFDAVFTAAGTEVIRTGIRAPRQNSIVERWFRSLRTELRTTTTPTAHTAHSARPHPRGLHPTTSSISTTSASGGATEPEA